MALSDKEISALYFEALGSQHLREQDRKMVTRFAHAVESEVRKQDEALIRRLEDACEWLLSDEDNGVWASGCGEAWCFIDGGPEDNNMRFCHGCGKPVAIAAQQGEKT